MTPGPTWPPPRHSGAPLDNPAAALRPPLARGRRRVSRPREWTGVRAGIPWHLLALDGPGHRWRWLTVGEFGRSVESQSGRGEALVLLHLDWVDAEPPEDAVWEVPRQEARSLWRAVTDYLWALHGVGDAGQVASALAIAPTLELRARLLRILGKRA